MTLIERLEAATWETEVFRELDAQIWLAVTPGATREKWSYVHKATGRESHIDETRLPNGAWVIVPHYTTSLDAALTLVPEGYDYRQGTFDGGKSFNAVVTTPTLACLDWSSGCERAPTPALAICIAALKAREAMSND